MKLKKRYIIFFLVLGFLFLGNTKVEAATYKYCEYKLNANAVYNEKGDTVGTDSFIKLVYKDKTLVSFVFENIDYNNQAYRFDATITNSLDISRWKPILVDGNCPDVLESNRAYLRDRADPTFDPDHKSSAEWLFKFYLNDDPVVYNDNDINQPLTCTYQAAIIGNASHAPYYLNAQNQQIHNKINITFSSSDLFHPTASIDTSVSKPKNESKLTNRLLEVLSGTWIHNNDVNVGAKNEDLHSLRPPMAYKYLLDSLKNKKCPTYILYNQPDGYYVADWEVQTGDAPNLFGTDNDYTLYKVDYEKYCATKKQEYQNQFKSTNDYIDTKIAELNQHIIDKDLTQEQYDNYLKIYDNLNTGITSGTGDYAFLAKIEDDFGTDATCANTEYYAEANSDKDKLTVKASQSGELYQKLIEANNVSTIIAGQEKENNKKRLDDIINTLAENFSNLQLGGQYNKEQSCESIFNFDDPDSFGSMLQRIFDMIKIIAPILVIVFGSLDFGKAVIASDQDELKKAQSKFIKRCIAAVALFFLPTIINILFQWIDQTTCNLK